MKTKIYCVPTEKGVLSLYLQNGSERLFLFHQPYRKGVAKYFSQGAVLEDAIDYSKAHGDTSLIHTMEKLPLYIKYLENKYGMEVFDKKRKKMVFNRIKEKTWDKYLVMH